MGEGVWIRWGEERTKQRKGVKRDDVEFRGGISLRARCGAALGYGVQCSVFM